MRALYIVVPIVVVLALAGQDASALDRASMTGRIVGIGNRCLDVQLGGGPGSRVVAWECHDGENQRWTLRPDGTIENAGHCLDAQLGRSAPGTAVIVWGCHGGANQRWVAEADGTIRGIGDMCLDVQRQASPSTVMLWPCHAGDNQQWSFEPLQ